MNYLARNFKFGPLVHTRNCRENISFGTKALLILLILAFFSKTQLSWQKYYLQSKQYCENYVQFFVQFLQDNGLLLKKIEVLQSIVHNPASGQLQLSPNLEILQPRHNYLSCRHSQTFLTLSFFSIVKFSCQSKFMSISSLVLQL